MPQLQQYRQEQDPSMTTVIDQKWEWLTFENQRGNVKTQNENHPTDYYLPTRPNTKWDTMKSYHKTTERAIVNCKHHMKY